MLQDFSRVGEFDYEILSDNEVRKVYYFVRWIEFIYWESLIYKIEY